MSIITAALTNRTHRCFLFIVYLFLAMPNAGAQDTRGPAAGREYPAARGSAIPIRSSRIPLGNT